LKFSILPPWWRTWWAYTLYVLLILSGMFLYVYVQQRKLRREREVSTRLRDADNLKSTFVSQLEDQVDRATSELRNSVEALTLKNQELEIAQQRASEGEQVKSRFLANMSHELRTPLNAMQGYLKLLAHTGTTTEQDEYLRTVQHSSDSLLAIINDTLDLSRIESGKLLIDEVDFNLLELIENIVELLGPSAYARQLALIRIIPPGIPLHLRGDPLRIRQILTNLIGNAIKFTPHGSICIRVQETRRQAKTVQLGIAISDTGIGISASAIDGLFDAYSRQQSSDLSGVEGTGLGLSICKKLLDLMGGEMEVMSTPGVGSTFEFRLGFKVASRATSPATFPPRIRVGLYDPHPLSRQAWQASLTRMGLEPVTLQSMTETAAQAFHVLIRVLDMREMESPELPARQIGTAAPARLVLAPSENRQTLDRLATLFGCPVLSALVAESAVSDELRKLIPPAAVAPGTHTTEPQPDAPIERSASQQPLILVADDNAINRKLLITLLHQNGYRTREAGSGAELLRLAATVNWDLALVDIHMPGMDGIEAVRRLIAARSGSHPPIIAVSADALPETRANALAAGMLDFLLKPYTEAQLQALLKQYLPTPAPE
ncbi:MAG TPA: ATP-binding protein, partial [Gammaproteobacteria bacterium]|nr:ATP-binding protein [Gammaproteobacteria bacterium]